MTETMTSEIERNHGLYDKAVKDYSLGIFCVQIHNYDLLSVWLYLRHDSKWPNYISQARKRRPASKSADGFPRSGSCSIWMSKPLKSRVLVPVHVGRVRAVYKRALILLCQTQSILLIRVCNTFNSPFSLHDLHLMFMN